MTQQSATRSSAREKRTDQRSLRRVGAASLIGTTIAMILFARKNGIPVWSMFDVVAAVAPIGLLFGRIANFINGELWGRIADGPWAVVFPTGGPFARHPSQLYEAGLEGVLLGALLLWLALARGWLKTPGRIAAMFFAGYGAARFFVEFFRQPDEQFVSPGNPLGLAWHVGGWGLTMGQLLSLPMIVVGLWLVLRKRPA